MKIKSKKSSSILLYFVLFIVLTLSLGGCLVILKNDNQSNNDNPTETEIVLKGANISFLGDSITTYKGWSNNTNFNSTIGDNYVWYNKDKIDNVNSTYWKSVVDDLELNLCVNNSWSASKVTCDGSDFSIKSSSCMNRSLNLHNDKKNIEPNIIVVNIGINDRNSTLGEFTDLSSIYNSDSGEYIADLNIFANAYATMVHKIITRYNKSQVYLCTQLNYGLDCVIKMNSIISDIADYFNCILVDFYNDTGINSSNLDLYTSDNLHPNKLGFDLMTNILKSSIKDNYKK